MRSFVHYNLTVIVLAVRPASFTHKNGWGRIISKDMRPSGRILESASTTYKEDLVKKQCVLPPRCVRTAKIPSSKLAIFNVGGSHALLGTKLVDRFGLGSFRAAHFRTLILTDISIFKDFFFKLK